MEVQDDLMLGPQGLLIAATTSANPTVQTGAGPMGRTYHQDSVPLTAQTANVAALQAPTASTAMTLTAGTGVTTGLAPDGSGSTVYQFDVPRCPSLTSTSNLSGVNFTFTGYDKYGRKTTSKIAGPNNNTVIAPKAMASVLSVVPDATNAGTVSVGASDTFGLDYACTDATLLIPKWANSLGIDAGTLTTADTTSPATASTGDPRGTYKPSSSSDGTKRLCLWHHLLANQCGYNATQANLLGVTPV